MQKEKLKNIRNVELIDEDKEIYLVEGEEDQELSTIPEMRQINYINRKSAKTLSARVTLMNEELSEAIALSNYVPELVFKIQEEVDLLLSSKGGKKTNRVIDSKCHTLLAKALSEIMREDKLIGKIREKKVSYRVIGQEYEAPHPDQADLVKLFEKKIEGDKKDEESNRNKKR